MLFALICTDRPSARDLRAATRPAHLAYLDTQAAKLSTAGAMLDEEGQPCGSLLVIEAADAAEAAALAAADPYAQAGLFASTVLRPYRQVFRDGARLA